MKATKWKYPPELVERWIKLLDSGLITKEAIIKQYNIGRSELNTRLRHRRNMNKPKVEFQF